MKSDGVGLLTIDQLRFEARISPYLLADKIKFEILDLQLHFDSNPRMLLHTSTTLPPQLLGSFGTIIKQNMRQQVH
jgi:hypothetical protein